MYVCFDDLLLCPHSYVCIGVADVDCTQMLLCFAGKAVFD